MKLAVLMMCHKNPDQINQLVAALSDDVIDIFIHVDKKSDISDQINIKSHVYLITDDKRIDVRWGTFSQVEAELVLLESALYRDDYDYYWLITGQDYPLVSAKDLVRIIGSKQTNYIDITSSKHLEKRNDIFYPDWIFNHGIFFRVVRRCWVELTGGYSHTFRCFKRKCNPSVSFFFGSAYWCLNKQFVKYLYGFLNENQAYMDFFHNSSCPDESFFHTVFMNSPYKDERSDYLHFIIWSKGKSSPNNLSLDDLPNAFNSKKLMARKIDLCESPTIIQEIERLKHEKS